MFINALVFINSSVVYKLWGGRGGGGGGGQGSWNISSRVCASAQPSTRDYTHRYLLIMVYSAGL